MSKHQGWYGKIIVVASALLILTEGIVAISLRTRLGLSSSCAILICSTIGYSAFDYTEAPHRQLDLAMHANGDEAPADQATRKGDWTQWCGRTDRNMIWNEIRLPDEFEAISSSITSLKNVKWVVPLAKRTLGSPVIAHGRVYIGGEDLQDGKEISMLWCFEESSGKLLWRMKSPYIPWLYNLSTFGNCATPTVEGEYLYTCNHLGDVLCLSVLGMANGNKGSFQDEAQYFASGRKIMKSDIAQNGKHEIECTAGVPATLSPFDADIIWRFDLIAEVNCWPFNALNSAVLVRGNTLFVGTGTVLSDPYFKTESSALKIAAWSKQHNNAEMDSPSLIALDKASGKLLARDKEDIFRATFHGAHSSPALGSVNGKDLLFYGGGNGTCYAFDPDFQPNANGVPAEISCVWKFNCLSERTARAEIISTPVFYKNRVYVSIGNDLAKSGAAAGPGRLVCIDASLSGDISTRGKIWAYDEIRSSVSTVAIADGLLYTGDAAGNIYCFDADSGRLYWRHTAKHPVWSSPLVADGKVYVPLHNGGVLIFAHGKEKKILSENMTKEDVISSPAVANGVLYIAGQRHLYALELGKCGGLITSSAESDHTVPDSSLPSTKDVQVSP